MTQPVIYSMKKTGNDATFTPKNGKPINTWDFCFRLAREFLDQSNVSVIEVVHCTIPHRLNYQAHNQAAKEIAALPNKIAGVNNYFFDQTFFPAFVRNLQRNPNFVEEPAGNLYGLKDYRIIRFTKT